MKRNVVILAVVLVVLVVGVSVYGAYNVLYSAPPSPSPSPTLSSVPSATPSPTPAATPQFSSTPTSSPTPTPTTPTASPSPSASPTPIVTPRPSPTQSSPSPTPAVEIQNKTFVVTDVTGAQVTLNLPLKRVVLFDHSLTELVYVMGGADTIVGRSETCTFPPSVLDIPVVSNTGYSFNTELVLELEPDLVLSDTTVSYNTKGMQELKDAGIPLIIDETGNYTRITEILRYLGTIFDNETRAQTIIDFMDYYENIVSERLGNLTDSEKPLVYLEQSWANWQTSSEGSISHDNLVAAGGINIAAELEAGGYPEVSPEYVLDKNPDVIIKLFSDSNLTTCQTIRDELLSRAGLSDTKAVANNRVYLFDYVLFNGIRHPVGMLYWVTWLHPGLFADIDPDAVLSELMQEFYGVQLEGLYAYPDTVTIVDSTDTPVTLTLPINRIACLNDGLTGVICALGCEDQIVGRPDAFEGYPRSILEKTNVGNSLTPNLEIMFELKPDLVVVDSAIFYYGDETLNKIKAAGLQVIMEDSGTPSRLTTIITNFGQILNKTDRAAEIIGTIDQYTSLITTRLENVTDSERPTFYLALMDYGWLTMTNGSNANDRLVACGGINIAVNSTVMYPELSAEYIIEANPDVIIVSAYGGSNLQIHQYARNQIMDNPILSDVTAVKEGRVHTYNDCVATGVQYPAGWLYFAKCFHPDLFADIDPAAIHAELIQDFFGEEIDGVYVYP
ncbi:MAG: ABC transporter substrate-binding protein [Candidatus Bathyarchaeota archaeon]|nr:ABC transporter substrate-binding protein [Candidatus Bathyarchaeota archaeon]